MGLKSLLFGKLLATNNLSHDLTGHAYDAAVALDPPVKGSYPVAGNGPNTLDELQRSRAKRDGQRATGGLARTHSSEGSTAAPPPDIPRYRAEIHERPQTAPHNGMPGGGYQNPVSGVGGRTRSGFLMKSPPAFLAHGRQDPMRSTSAQVASRSPPPPTIPPAATRPHIPQRRDVRSYQPTKPVDDADTFADLPPPFRQHGRSESLVSHRSHVDLFDAHSNIRPSPEASRYRAKASGMRNYGEDVADRNMADTGSRRDKALDMNSPEFSYLKAVYSPKGHNGPVIGESSGSATGPGTGPGSRAISSSALDHVLGLDTAGPSSSDDIQPTRSATFTSSSSSSSSAKPHSLRSNATAPSPSYTSIATRGYDERGRIPNGDDHPARALSPASTETPPASSYGENPARAQPLDSPPTPPIPARGTARPNPLPGAAVITPKTPVQVHNPRPVPVTSSSRASSSIQVKDYAQPIVAAPSALASNRVKSESRKALSFSSDPPEIIHPVQYSPPSLKDRKHTMSLTSQNSDTNGQTPNNGPVSYSPYPNSISREDREGSMDATPCSPTTGTAKRQGMIVEAAKEPPSLKGVVDLSNTVDTDVTTKTLPAVIHEHVTPTRHEIREERVTREIHTHDVYHRILPVIETIVLPTKHYIHSPDGTFLIEIPEIDVPKYTGRPLESINQGWKLVRDTRSLPDIGSLSLDASQSVHQNPAPPRQDTATLLSQDYLPAIQNYAEKGKSVGSPVAGADLGEQKRHPGGEPSTSKSSPITTTTRTDNSLEPILSSKKTYVSKEGFPKTEYVWQHPPVFEDAEGRIQPISPSLRELIFRVSPPLNSKNDPPIQDDGNAAEYGVSHSEGGAEEDLLFRDLGYGSGMLPGLTEKTPTASYAPVSEPVLKSSPSGMHPGLTEMSPVASPASTPLPQSNTSPPSNASPSLQDRVSANDFDGKMKLGNVVGAENGPPSMSSRKVESVGEATKYLRRLKERRRSSFFPKVLNGNATLDKGKGKAVDTGRVDKENRNKRMSLY